MSDQLTCNCKRGYPIIDKVIGRSVDLIVDKNGKKIHSAFFSILFRTDQTVEQFQIQFDADTIQVSIKVDTSLFNEQKQNEYLKLIKSAMMFDNYIIQVNQPFLTSANAKHKYVIDKRTKI
jgi:phenylacetate-CoA ligase